MKFRSMALRVLLVIVLLAAVAVVGAQDVETEAPALSGIFVQAVDSGSFAELEDGSFTLTLNGVADYTPWQFISPELDGGRMSTNLISLYWGAMEELSTTALLETADVTVEITLSSPDFDLETGIMTFNVTVDEAYYTAIDADFKDEAMAPASFDDATLFIVLDQTFIDGFNEGAELAGVRGPNTSKNCSNPSNSNCNSLGFDTFNVR